MTESKEQECRKETCCYIYAGLIRPTTTLVKKHEVKIAASRFLCISGIISLYLWVCTIHRLFRWLQVHSPSFRLQLCDGFHPEVILGPGKTLVFPSRMCRVDCLVESTSISLSTDGDSYYYKWGLTSTETVRLIRDGRTPLTSSDTQSSELSTETAEETLVLYLPAQRRLNETGPRPP